MNDLDAFARPRLARIQPPANVHFTDAGYAEFAEPVTEAIEAALRPTS